MNFLQSQKFNNKKAIIRVDLNVPLNEKKEVTDYTRIEAIKDTVNFVIDNGGSCILLSHLGRPKEKDESLSLKNILDSLSKTLDKTVLFFQDCIGEGAEKATKELKPGEIILMENLRFYKEEIEGDKLFAEKLSRLGDLYINDAFGTCHREHASTYVIAKYFPKDKYVGKLLQKELEAISQIAEQGKKPVLAILGGAKVSSKLNILYNLIKKVDKIIIGGGMAYTFIAAQGGEIGESLIEEDLIENANEILEIAKRLNKEIILPDDIKASTDFDQNDLIKIFDSDKIQSGWMGLDIGPKTIDKFNKAILSSKTIFWNGPVGVFEKEAFLDGTKSVCNSLKEAKIKGVNVIVGGGDSIAALKKLGKEDWVSYISTGGGALLESLEGKTLPGVKALLNEN
ncbi:MAG: phosphoglycerate kinase [Actinomycetota bacterium]|nr:phosphoglycerate kinase [Actinomycetota bacterium]